MSRTNASATQGHGPVSPSRLLFVGVAAIVAVVIALIVVAQPFQGSNNGSPETATALAPSFSAPVAGGSVAITNAIAAHENSIEAQFGPQSASDLRAAEIAHVIAEHENAIAAQFGTMSPNPIESSVS